MPVEDEVYDFTEGSVFTGYDFSETGEDFVWNFAELESIGETSWHFEPVDETPFFYQLLFNNPWDPEYVANYALAGDDVDLGALTITDVYTYYQNNDSFYGSVGAGTTLNDLPIPAKAQPIDTIYKFPILFGDSHASYSETLFDFPGVLTWKAKQNRVTTVDGWGTVTTPMGMYECLRVKHELEITDSTVIPTLSIDIELPRPPQVIYQWLAQDIGVPVLQVTTTWGLNTEILYRTMVIGLMEENEQHVAAFPNPTRGLITIPYCAGSTLRVFNESGRLVIQHLSDSQPLDLSSQPAGIYTWKLDGDCGDSGTVLVVR